MSYLVEQRAPEFWVNIGLHDQLRVSRSFQRVRDLGCSWASLTRTLVIWWKLTQTFTLLQRWKTNAMRSLGKVKIHALKFLRRWRMDVGRSPKNRSVNLKAKTQPFEFFQRRKTKTMRLLVNLRIPYTLQGISLLSYCRTIPMIERIWMTRSAVWSWLKMPRETPTLMIICILDDGGSNVPSLEHSISIMLSKILYKLRKSQGFDPSVVTFWKVELTRSRLIKIDILLDQAR